MLFRFIALNRVTTQRILSKNYCSKVPSKPVSTVQNEDKNKICIDPSTITLLERLSLVKYDTPKGIKVLEDSITFANKILHINTDNIEPLYTTLENENLNLRPDKITQGNCQKDILKNATVKEDDYFVAPTGNIPLLEIENKELPLKATNKNEN